MLLLSGVVTFATAIMGQTGGEMPRAAGCQQTVFQLRSPADITSGCRAALTVRTERIIRREEEEQKSGIEREVINRQLMSIKNQCTAAAGHPVRTWGERS